MTADVELFDNLDAVADDAGKALGRDAQPWLFDRLSWFKLVHEFTPPDGRLLVIRADYQRARAWLFLSVDGANALALSNWYCLRFGTVFDGPRCPTLTEALVLGLRRAGVSRLFLSPIAEHDPLQTALKRKGWLTSRGKSNVSWRIDTSGVSFNEYWASRPSRLRNTTKRRAKTAALELRVHQSFDEHGWSDYESVYAASWKPAEGSPELMRRFAEKEGQAGTLRLGLAYMDGTPLAAQLWTVENGVAIIHKLAYREDAKQHSPGTILSAEMYRRAIDVDAVRMIDFGIGNDSYKADWMSDCVPLYALTAYDPLTAGGLAGIGRSVALKLVGQVRSRYARAEPA